MMRQDYVIDRPQARYFVVPNLEWLWQWTAPDLHAAAREAAHLPDLPVVPLPA
jgi:phenylalanine-4-hydroxylase